MPTLAFATCQHAPQINDDELLLAHILRGHGVTITAAIWDDPAINWLRFDAVVIRSTWDYHLKSEQYEQWLRTFADRPGQLWNPPQAVIENMHKSYLCNLAEKGLDVVPAHHLRRCENIALADLLHQHDWDEAVIKPAISASAHGTWRTSLATAEACQWDFTTQLRHHDLLVQPFMPEIAAQGEWSVVFFDGQFSHAALKLPAKGDFRVHREFGGTSSPAEPSTSLIEQAGAVLSAVPCPILYARVDGVVRHGRFMLMELEINEPFLFLNSSKDASRRFADAVIQKIHLHA